MSENWKKKDLKCESMSSNNLKPLILASACLSFRNCRYDGSVIPNAFIEKLKAYVEFETVCPEMGIGLPSPREALRIVKSGNVERLVDSYSGHDRSDAMDRFIEQFLKETSSDRFDGVILKCKSPTCGLKDAKTYPGTGKMGANPGKTEGYFGRSVSKHFTGMVIEDEGRLTHFNIREHFLISIFLHAEFRQVVEKVNIQKKLGPLVAFHSRHKYLFMAYHQKTLTQMGRILANHDKKSVSEVVESYSEALKFFYQAKPSQGKNINMLLHLFGYFKDKLSKEEKALFLDQLEQYQNNQVPFSTVLMLIKAWTVRFDEPYLKTQSLFELFPKDLIEVTDSGKGL